MKIALGNEEFNVKIFPSHIICMLSKYFKMFVKCLNAKQKLVFLKSLFLAIWKCQKKHMKLAPLYKRGKGC